MSVEAKSRSIRTATSYHIPCRTDAGLRKYVGKLERTASRRFLNPDAISALSDKIDVPSVLDSSLPPNLSQRDLTDGLKLSLLTESATDQYAGVFMESAERYDAQWLGRYIQNIWVPDESGHATPFMLVLNQLGVSEDAIMAEVTRVKGENFPHKGGTTPIHLSMYGTIQEYITTNWHTRIGKLLKPITSDGAKISNMVGSREAQHTRWERDMTALQIEGNPDLVHHAAEAVVLFEMPGNTLVPELQAKARDLLLAAERGNLDSMKRDLVKIVHFALGSDPKHLGRMLLEIGALNENWLERITARSVRQALHVGGEAGYGLLGEGVLQAVGLKGLYEDPGEDNIPGKIRAVLRNGVARMVNSRFDYDFGFSKETHKPKYENASFLTPGRVTKI